MHFTEFCKTWSIALTGGIASGKSTVGALLHDLGFEVVDADQLSRLVVAPGADGHRDLIKAFGPDILQADGSLNRAKMRQRIFAHPDDRLLLESIIHTRMAQYTEQILKERGLWTKPRPWFYEASLIFERQREADFYAVWTAYCPPDVQRQRLINRDQSSPEEAAQILAAQMSPLEKVKRSQVVIHTDCDRDELKQRVESAVRWQALPKSQF